MSVKRKKKEITKDVRMEWFFEAVEKMMADKSIDDADALYKKVENAIEIAASHTYGRKEALHCKVDPIGRDIVLVKEQTVVPDEYFDRFEKIYDTSGESEADREKRLEEINSVFDDPTIITVEDAEYLLGTDPNCSLIKHEGATGEGPEPDDTIVAPIPVDELGRIAAQTMKHVFRQGVKEIENSKLLEKFKTKKKALVWATVESLNPASVGLKAGAEKTPRFSDPEARSVTLEINGVKSAAILPVTQQIPYETFDVNDRIRVYVDDVKPSEKGEAKLLISRIHPDFVRKVFEEVVPEINEGFVLIKSIAREAGSKTKVAVCRSDKEGAQNIDPKSACIGEHSRRVNEIKDAIRGQNVEGRVIDVEERGIHHAKTLKGEEVNIIEYDPDPAVYIANALAPAVVKKVEILSETENTCRVTVAEDMLSLAIGNRGQNARLAARLTGWKIDIKSEND